MVRPKPIPSRVATPPASSVAAAIRQTRPFGSPAHEAVVGLLLTTETVRWPFQDLLAGHDLTLQQYNVLRILRGAGPAGLPTLEIATRMIERTPGVTRLIDRLERKALVARQRCADDRRQVFCGITDAGLALLKRLDKPIDALHQAVMAGLSSDQQAELIGLLDCVRQGLTAPRRRTTAT